MKNKGLKKNAGGQAPAARHNRGYVGSTPTSATNMQWARYFVYVEDATGKERIMAAFHNGEHAYAWKQLWDGKARIADIVNNKEGAD